MNFEQRLDTQRRIRIAVGATWETADHAAFRQPAEQDARHIGSAVRLLRDRDGRVIACGYRCDQTQAKRVRRIVEAASHADAFSARWMSR